MARGSFGGGAGDYVENSVGTRLPGAITSMWTAQTGGTQHTDLIVSGAAATTVTAGTRGYLPVFSGPDGVVEMWADGGGGPRSRLFASVAVNAQPRNPATDNVFYVSLAASSVDTNDGRSWGSAFRTIAAAMTALATFSGTIHLGRGDHTVSGVDASGNGVTLKTIGQHIVGLGRGTTRIVIDTPATWGVKLEAATCTLRGMTIRIAPTRAVTYATGVGTLASPGSAQYCQFTDVHVNVAGTVTACYALGPDFPGSSSIDIANTVFTQCSYDGTTANITNGWLSGNGTSGNVTSNFAYSCVCVGGAFGITLSGSGFQWFGGSFALVRTADAQITQGHRDQFGMHGARSENGVKAFQSSYGGQHGGVMLNDCSFGAYVPTDNIILTHNLSGPLTINGGSFENTSGITKLRVNTANGPGARGFTAVGVYVNDADPYPVASAFVTRTILAAQKLDAGGVVPNVPYGRVIDGHTAMMGQVNSAANVTLAATYLAAASATFTAPTAGKAFISAAFDVSFGGTSDFISGQLKVDTVLEGRDVLAIGTVNRLTLSRSWVVPLAAGSHTLEIGASRFQGAGASVLNGTQTGFTYHFVPDAL